VQIKRFILLLGYYDIKNIHCLRWMSFGWVLPHDSVIGIMKIGGPEKGRFIGGG